MRYTLPVIGLYAFGLLWQAWHEGHEGVKALAEYWPIVALAIVAVWNLDRRDCLEARSA